MNCTLKILLIVASILLCTQAFAQNSANGHALTPKGSQRVLIIYAAFSNALNQPLGSWPTGTPTPANNYGLPNYVEYDGTEITTHKFFFNKETDFDDPLIMGDPDNKSVSKILNVMSKPNEDYRLYGDVFHLGNGDPSLVVIDPFTNPVTGAPQNLGSWSTANQRVIQQAMLLNPTFDWAAYDQRANNPNFSQDVSNTGPDGELDYVMIIYRYDNSWPIQPTPTIPGWSGSGGGLASIDVGTINGVDFGDGFTLAKGKGVPINLFVHEFMHTLIRNPHTMGANGVIGNHLYLSKGWGAMALPGWFDQTFNSWERWYAGFIDPVEITTSGVYPLTDFITTGESLRIRIPNSGDQNLWIENHTGSHELDHHSYLGSNIGPNFPDVDPGVYMMVEDIAPTRGDVNVVASGAGGLKTVHPDGNWDFRKTTAPPIFNNWNNELHQFEKVARNPIGGLAVTQNIPVDLNNDGVITNDYGWNGTSGSEALSVARELANGDNLWYRGWGAGGDGDNPSAAFKTGDKLEMQGNPVLNHPGFDQSTQQLDPYILNGLKVEIISTGPTAMVEVTFEEVNVNSNVRWTGDIELPNITGDTNPDLILGNSKKITLDVNGTPNRETIHPLTNDFVTPTVMTITSGSKVHMLEKSNITVKRHSTLIIEDGAEVILEDGACIVVEETGTLYLKGNKIQTNGSGSVLVFRGTLKTDDNVDFNFTGPGFASFESTHKLELGVNSDFVLHRTTGQNRFLELKNNTVLEIADRSLFLKNGKVQYGQNAKIKATNAAVNLFRLSMVELNGHSQIGLEGHDLTNFNATQVAIEGLEKGLELHGNTTIPKIIQSRIDKCTVGVEAHGQTKIEIRNCNFYDNLEAAVSIYETETAFLDNNRVNASTLYGYNFKEVVFANIRCGEVKNCYVGINASQTNTFLRKGVQVTDNETGVEYYANSVANFALTVGDAGAAAIKNNKVGVRGENIILHIDAVEHGLENETVTLPNNFGGNQKLFDICYSDPSFVPYTIPMKGNYWGGSSVYSNNFSLFHSSCGAPNYIQVDGANFFTTYAGQPNGCLFQLPPQGPTVPNQNCALYVKGKLVYLANISKTGHRELLQEKYTSAKQNFSVVASVNSKTTMKPVCRQKVYFAKCMVNALGSTKSLITPSFPYSGGTIVKRESQESLSAFKLSPNPATASVNISVPGKYNDQQLSIHILDLMGNRVKSINLYGQSQSNIDLSGLASGIYLVSIYQNSERITSEKLVVHSTTK